MGAGGGLWAQYNIAFGPRQFFFAQTFAVLAMIVVGGLASVSGAVIGATVVTAFGETTVSKRVSHAPASAAALEGSDQAGVEVGGRRHRVEGLRERFPFVGIVVGVVVERRSRRPRPGLARGSGGSPAGPGSP